MKPMTWLAALVVCAGPMLPGLLSWPALAAAQGPVVRVADGPVAGITADGADEFLGIPFAAPPVGPLRWKAPQAPAHWTDPRDASKHERDAPPLPPAIASVSSTRIVSISTSIGRPAPPRAPSCR